MAGNGKFLHRPISVTVEEVLAMDTVRIMPAEETLVIVNVKLDQRRARALAKMLLEKVLASDDEVVDLVTFSLKGTLK
jgi:hypothetical protein